jgi:hypothetical protein
MTDSMDPDGKARRDDHGAASTPLVVAAAIALAIVTGFVVVSSHRGGERMGDTAAAERSSGNLSAQSQAPARREASGSNVPPAAAPSPNR